jgi:hypothetical protein
MSSIDGIDGIDGVESKLLSTFSCQKGSNSIYLTDPNPL